MSQEDINPENTHPENTASLGATSPDTIPTIEIDGENIGGGATPSDETPDADPTTPLRARAASDQRDAAAGYASEAARNGYPGAGEPPHTGDPYAAYPGWDRGKRKVVVYDKPGASIGTVVLGAIVAICSAAMIALLVFGNMLAVPDFWQRFGAFAAIGVGIVLIIGGIVSGIRNRRQK